MNPHARSFDTTSYQSIRLQATLAEGVNQSHTSQLQRAEKEVISVRSPEALSAWISTSTAYAKTASSLRQRAQNTQQAQHATNSTVGCNPTLKTSTLQKHCLQSACKVCSVPNGMAARSLLTQKLAAWNPSSTVAIRMQTQARTQAAPTSSISTLQGTRRWTQTHRL